MPSRPTTAPTARTAGASASKLTRELRPALGLVQPRAGEGSGAVQHGARAAGALPDSGRVARQAALPELRQQPRARTASSWSTPTSSAAASARCRRTTSRRALDAAYQLSDKQVLRGGLRPVLRRVREPRRQPEPRLQLPVPVHADLPVAERRRAEPARRTGRSSASTRATRIPLDPLVVNANGLTLRGVEFDYKTPRYHNYNVTLQTRAARPARGRGRLRRHARRNLETFTGMNNVTQLLPPGTNPRRTST